MKNSGLVNRLLSGTRDTGSLSSMLGGVHQKAGAFRGSNYTPPKKKRKK